MPYYIYTTEALPDPDLMGVPGYTPDSEWLKFGGVQLPQLPAEQWTRIPDRFVTFSHRDWRDRAGKREYVAAEDIVSGLKTRFEQRGVVFLDHEPTKAERDVYELKSRNASQAYRMKAVEWYENQVREREVTGIGRTTPTPYENKCYELLGLTKPYSVEAMRAQRHPGEAVGEQIVNALERLEKRRHDQAAVDNKPAAPAA